MSITSGIGVIGNQFSGSLRIDVSEDVEAIAEELSQQDSLTSQGGDTVEISEKGQAMAMASKTKKTEESDDEPSESDMIINRLKEQIQKLEQEIKELEKSDLPEKQKRQQIQSKQDMLLQFRDQLAKAQKDALQALGGNPSGGTDAQGFSSSLT